MVVKREKIVLLPAVGTQDDITLWRRVDGTIWLVHGENEDLFSRYVYNEMVVPYFYMSTTPDDALMMGISTQVFEQMAELAATNNSMLDKLESAQALNCTLPVIDEVDEQIIDGIKNRVSDKVWGRIKELAVYNKDVAAERIEREKHFALRQLDKEISEAEQKVKDLKRTRANWLGETYNEEKA